MPKAASRTFVARAEPYPTSKPDENTGTRKPFTTKKALAEQSAATTNASPQYAHFLEVKLDDEDEEGNIPCYDTCSTVRQKINAILGKYNKNPENGNPTELAKDGSKKPFTKASFLRAIGTGQNATLDRFLKAKEIMGGAESAIYPAAYKFFEKKRIFEGKKKTAGRLKVEAERPLGLPLRDPRKIYVTVRQGENPRDFLDQYGQ